MSDYHVSFGVQYPRQPHPTYPQANGNGYVTIDAIDEPQARAVAYHLFGDRWSFLYAPDEEMHARFWPLGEIERFDAATVLGVTR